MTRLDDILDRYGMDRGRLAAFADAAVRMNFRRAAEEADLGTTTAHKYKNKLNEMAPEERAYVLSSVLTGRWAELADAAPPLDDDSERSEASSS